MRKFSLIKEKILQYLDYKGITKYKFYQETGITRGILDQNNGMAEENVAKILAYYREISPDWLILGQGDMLRCSDEPVKQESTGECKICQEKERIIDALKCTISTQDTLIKVLMQGNKTQQNENQ